MSITGTKTEIVAEGFLNNLKLCASSQMPYSIAAGEFKRDYDFIWSVHYPSFSSKATSTAVSFNNFFKRFVGTSQFAWTYISRMAKSVTPASLELEEEEVNIGIYEQTIPLKVKYGNIKVTYIDDLFETVWNAHQNWLQLIGTGAVPIEDCCLQADLWTTTGAVLALIENLFPILKPIIELVASGDLYFATSETHYEHIYPINVSRSDANKEGQDLATVTVEYKIFFPVRLQNLYVSYDNGTTTLLGGRYSDTYILNLAQFFKLTDKL